MPLPGTGQAQKLGAAEALHKLKDVFDRTPKFSVSAVTPSADMGQFADDFAGISRALVRRAAPSQVKYSLASSIAMDTYISAVWPPVGLVHGSKPLSVQP
jgi:hypothetical protein